MNREAPARLSVRHSTARALRVGKRGRVRSLTATMARATRRSMAMSVAVEGRRLSMTDAASDAAD